MDGHSIRERLDCSLANNLWFMKFPGSIVNHHRCNSSNHCPLLINLSEFEPPPPKLPTDLKKCGYQMKDVLKPWNPHGLLLNTELVTVVF